MSESHFDEYEHYNFTEDNKLYSNHSGRLRTKKVGSFVFPWHVFLSNPTSLIGYCRRPNFIPIDLIQMDIAAR